MQDGVGVLSHRAHIFRLAYTVFHMTQIVVGLGNPGMEYERTRHNVGRVVVTRVTERLQSTGWRHDTTLNAQVCVVTVNPATQVHCVLPEGYMNRSGASVAPLVRKLGPETEVVVVHDDIDLPLGTIRIVHDRGAGGHNGVLSIERTLKTRQFTRVRVGVVPVSPTGELKKPRGADAVERFILKPLTSTQVAMLAHTIETAVDATIATLRDGRDAAMRRYNGSAV